MDRDLLVELKHISKSFDGVKALSEIDLVLKKGEIHCLAGQNGSGKSTLVKIVTGVYSTDEGQVIINGHEYPKLSPGQAMKEGIQVIYQDLSLFDHMTIAENIALNKLRQNKRGIVDWKEIREIASRQTERIGVSLDLDATIAETSMGNRQITAICRALAMDAKVLFMDEPTTALPKSEVDKLLSIVLELKAGGLSIIFISHKLDEVFKISDRITVFRDGRIVGRSLKTELTEEKLSFLMTGRSVHYSTYRRECADDRPLLRVDKLSKKGMYKELSFEARKGDIVGMIGLLGAGRTELGLSLYGLNKPDSGAVEFDGRAISIDSPMRAKDSGIALLPENRLSQGLFLEKGILENITSSVIDRLSKPVGLFNKKTERKLAAEGVERLKVKTPSIYAMIKNLSGGNQQKVVISKWLFTKPKLFILDSPTVGIDVGSKAEIYEIIQKLARDGMAILLISDEVEELLGNCNRVLVMSKGSIVARIDEEELQDPGIKEKILALVGQAYSPSMSGREAVAK